MLVEDEFDTDYPDLFTLKLAKFHHLEAGDRLAILQRYREFLCFVRNHLECSQRRVSSLPEIGEAERVSILNSIGHRSHLVQADDRWIERQIEDVAQSSAGMKEQD
jgi:hypothetical protein